MKKAAAESTDQQQVKQPRPRLGIMLAATFLAMIVIAGAVMFINRQDDAEQSATPATPDSASVNGDDRPTELDRLGRIVYVPDNAAGDVLDKTSETSEDAAPDVEWQRLSRSTEITIARDYPFSADAGPWEVTDGVAHGFAHSSQGAALAGIHAFLGVGQGGEKAAQAMKQFMADPEAKKAAQHMLDNPKGPQSPEAPWTSTFAAYTVLSHDDDSALIRYACPAGEGFSQVDVKLVWADGDWQLAPGAAVSQNAPVSEDEVSSWLQL